MRLSLPLMFACAAVAMAGPALSQSRIQVGQTVSGALATTDPRLDDGSHIDCYDLQTQVGQRLQIDQTSDAFDSYLSLVGGGCATPATTLTHDDDGGGGLNARIVRDGDGSVWAVVVNSLEAGSTGPYQLRVSTVSSGGGARPAPAAPTGAAATAPPAARPAAGLQRYVWDMICMAADNYSKINHGVEIDDPQSMRILQAATASGEALGKDSQAIGDELMMYFMPYTTDPRAYFAMSASDLRTHCISLL